MALDVDIRVVEGAGHWQGEGPALVEAVLLGRQPAQLTLRQVMKQLPWDWSEQRRRFGLAPGINDSLSVRD